MPWLYIIALDTFKNASKFGRSINIYIFCFGRNAAKIAVVKIAAQKDPIIIVFRSETYRFNLSLC